MLHGIELGVKKFMIKYIIIIIFLLFLIFNKPLGVNAMEIPSLKEVYKNYFYIGAAVTPINIYKYEEILIKHFNSLTPENQMKWEVIHPSPNTYNFKDADEIVKFAQKNNMKVRGHTLLWHQQVPSWVFRDENGNMVSKAELFRRLEEHIKKVVGYYKCKVYAWDVVNEALSDNPSEFLRDAPWYRIGGEEIIEKAFIWAHNADPQAKLFYNDYNLEDPVKRDKAFQLVKRLKDKNIPIHGIGIQGHWTLSWPTPSMLDESIKKLSSLGVEIQVTEFDISIYYDRYENNNFKIPPEDRLEKQAKLYKDAFEVLRKHKDKVTGVTFWGVADDYTWLYFWPIRGREDYPLLFDKELKPKKAFWEIVKF
jgi:endo-1,4-beta-xylanase